VYNCILSSLSPVDVLNPLFPDRYIAYAEDTIMFIPIDELWRAYNGAVQAGKDPQETNLALSNWYYANRKLDNYALANMIPLD